ncbi:MAG: threonine-phosphate decarboxylase [Sulfobacillus acidophilus]|uniref:Aminotransferase n=1 Tax=Sulfobacillus acidophilus TaxID=53633 RepID=A0A2T2WH14_9FIRM|nr:MAG: threonine-phosphate decarboxylase [Sulfobacillus acidophilus]
MDVSVADHGGQIHQAARALGLPVSQILDFSANINPLGPPPSVRRALVQALDDIRFYPDSTQAEVKQVIADLHQVRTPQVLVSNGATEAIDLALRKWNPTRVWVLEPAFSEYRAAAFRHRLRVVSMRLASDFSVPWDRLIARAQPGDCVIWNNPHNPTGRHVRRGEFMAPVQALAKRGVAVLIDESFMDFVRNAQECTAIAEAFEPASHVAVVRSLTKFLAIPGLRLGYAIADCSWVQDIERVRDRWSVSHLAQVAGAAGLKDLAFRDDTFDWLYQEQLRLKELWGPNPLYRRYPTSVNFFLMRWADAELANVLLQALFDRGILVRSCADFLGLGPSYWRIAIRRPVDNDALQDAVQECLREGHGRWLRV